MLAEYLYSSASYQSAWLSLPAGEAVEDKYSLGQLVVPPRLLFETYGLSKGTELKTKTILPL